MGIKNKILVIAIMLFAVLSSDARNNPEQLQQMKDRVEFASPRMNCQPAQSQIDLEINNVRARLLTGGDLWWDKSNGRYVVPKPADGFDEVSAIFAGGVWIGGVDPNGNLKLAGTQYATGANTDWYPGPLDEDGVTDQEVCEDWDEFFTVTGEEVQKHVAAFDESIRTGVPLICEDIAPNVLFWPGRGNPYWGQNYSFPLPDQNLGDFWDNDGDGIYNACNGDFPVINIVGCEPESGVAARELLPDEMIFWIYNDNGGVHGLSQADAIQMEVQVQAFAYATNDEINDMTFYRYKLINKGKDDIRDCYFAMWVDADLGCSEDDYIGCDVDRSLAIIYNEDATDGSPGTSCPGGVNTYRDDVPMLGIDYFRGPRAPKVFVRDGNGNVVIDPETGNPFLVDPAPGEQDTLVELGMTSFLYQNRGVSDPAPATLDPQRDFEFYNILQGLWLDGTPVTFGASGFNPGSTDTISYVFPDAPNDVTGWSMCTAELPFDDRRTVQATGPLILQPGAQNELIIGVVFVPSVDYPCPDITRLQFADDLAQALFDNCFDITDGPDAPDMFAVELDRQLILLLSNDSLEVESNNALQNYAETDLQAPEGVDDSLYRFEGYKIYQLANPNVTVQELDDIDKARIIQQVDVKNGVSDIYNWYPLPNPNPNVVETVWFPSIEVAAGDAGIKHSFNVQIDQFAETSDRRLINHKNYYYTVVAYGYNNYQQYIPNEDLGQRKPYIEGRKNVNTYTFTPRPVVYKELMSAYGQEAPVTRLQGVGTGFNALAFADADFMDRILDGSVATTDSGTVIINYAAGNGPINPAIIDPLNVKNASYRLEIVGEFNDSKLLPRIEEGARWNLINTTDPNNLVTIMSEKTIEEINEQIIYGEGFSLSVNQVGEPGSGFDDSNGGITQMYEYADDTQSNWFNAVPALGGVQVVVNEEEDITNSFYSYVNESIPESIYGGDPSEDLSKIDDGYFIPMRSTRWDEGTFYVTPSWKGSLPITYGTSNTSNRLAYKDLNNVNIVFTSDKSKWSECVVVESAVPDYNAAGISTKGSAFQFNLRDDVAIDINGNPTGEIDEDGDVIKGKSFFPGYAIDVETGERLNIFFGENSVYTAENDALFNSVAEGITFSTGNGGDMIWNPSQELFATELPFVVGSQAAFVYNNFAGGQHYIYVTRQTYDGCDELHSRFNGNATGRRDAVAMITWTGFPIPQEPLLSLAEGLIPNDLTVRLRVQNPFNRELDLDRESSVNRFDPKGSLPVYEFAFGDVEARDLEPSEFASALDNVQVVPNPYYAYSSYEQNQFENIVKVTNLPSRAIVTIYTLDGKFIQQFDRDAMPGVNQQLNPALAESQVAPAIEWNLTNNKGIPVASGVYIFHISAPDLGIEKSIKWFGVNRRFDPTGL